MVETRPPNAWAPAWHDDGIRPEATPGGPPPLPPTVKSQPGQAVRQRIPTMRQLALLVVNGILTLPGNYRRGMYLDIWV
ncbi:MAG: hypothetical protein GC168_19895 [Candidatus Hydrogenedens sp.]|nr:hypothetical protein [Candidatus Hydrogenedens sp.]